MNLEQHIQEIREGIAAGRFSNEAAVSQGIVLRLLHALSWPAYDTQIVCPEFSLEGRRVDFALCHPPQKPVAFIEVKQIGQSENAERQLFEYAFHIGVPFAILTDGREWNFFLPAEQGDYGERRVYKLDLVERDTPECVFRLNRYLKYDAIISGKAIDDAREDYRHVSRDRLIKKTLPDAWRRMVEEDDDLLLELLADRVESLCGYKPDLKAVAAFIKNNISLIGSGTKTVLPPTPKPKPPPAPEPPYIEAYRKMLKNPRSLISQMRKHIDDIGKISWAELKNYCIQHLGCKSKESGSIGASLKVLERDGYIRIEGWGESKRIISLRASK